MSKSAIKLAISNISNRTRIKGARKVVRKSSKTQQSKRFIRTSVVSVFRSREYQTQWLLKVVVDGIWKCLKMSWLTFIQRASFCWWKRSNKVLDLSWEMSGNVTNMHVVFINSFIDPLGDQRATRSHKVHSVLSVCVKHDCFTETLLNERVPHMWRLWGRPLCAWTRLPAHPSACLCLN